MNSDFKNDINELVQESKNMLDVIVKPVPNELGSLMDAQVALESYCARIGEMLARAKFLKSISENAWIEQILFENPEYAAKPSLVNKKLSVKLKDESYAVEFIENLRSSIDKIMSSRITRISELKGEMRQLTR